jgi:hypothetical protein
MSRRHYHSIASRIYVVSITVRLHIAFLWQQVGLLEPANRLSDARKRSKVERTLRAWVGILPTLKVFLVITCHPKSSGVTRNERARNNNCDGRPLHTYFIFEGIIFQALASISSLVLHYRLNAFCNHFRYFSYYCV